MNVTVACYRCGSRPHTAAATVKLTIVDLFDLGWRSGPGSFLVCGDCLRWPWDPRYLKTTQPYKPALSPHPN